MLYALFAVPAALVLAWMYVAWRISRRPSYRPDTERASEGDSVLLCLGDSITHGALGGNWVASLRAHLAGEGWLVANGGINGQQVWNIAQRLERALECRPDMAVLFIGTNDVMAQQRSDRAALYVKQNRLPQVPDLDWSIAQLVELVPRLCAAVSRVALCTIPPLGDDEEHEIAALVARYNRAVREQAAAHGCVLLDVHGAVRSLLGPARRPYVGAPRAIFRLIMSVGAAHYLRGRSWDAIARSAGFGATVDGIHLTDTAAARVHDLVAGFVREGERA